MKASRCLLSIVVLAALIGWPGLGSARKAPKPLTLEQQLLRTPEEIEPLIKIEGDELDARLKVSTQEITVTDDNNGWPDRTFMRAFIDKKTGEVSSQIYRYVRYGGRGWYNFERASYQFSGQLKEVSLVKIAQDVQCYSADTCAHQEDVAIPIDFSELEAIADTYSPDQRFKPLPFRLFGRGGETVDDAFSRNEVIAFVRVVRRARQVSQ